MKTVCVILGAGGHARVLIDCLLSMKNVEIHGILDPKQDLWNRTIMGVPVLGNDERLADLIRNGITSFVIGLGGSGNNAPRRKLFEQARGMGLEPLIVLHATAIVSKWAAIGKGCQLLPGCIVNAGARLGENVIVNSGAIVEHDCIINDHVHVATGAKLASTIRVGREAHIGAGASVRQCLSIGDRAIVGIGAVVVKDVPPDTVVVGNPAKPLERAHSR